MVPCSDQRVSHDDEDTTLVGYRLLRFDQLPRVGNTGAHRVPHTVDQFTVGAAKGWRIATVDVENAPRMRDQTEEQAA